MLPSVFTLIDRSILQYLSRTTIKYEEDLLDEILEPKKRKKKAKNLITKKKILKTKKVKNESKSEKGNCKLFSHF